MLILTIRKRFQAFKTKFEPFERDLKLSNPTSNHSKGIRSIRMQIRTIRKRFKAFEIKLQPFERDSKHSNAHSNHSKGIRSFRIQLRTIRKEFEAFESNFEPFEREEFECKFELFEKYSKLSKPNSNHSKGIQSF